MNLTQGVKFTRVANAAAAGSTDVTGSAVDMTVFQAATFVCALGAMSGSPVTTAGVLKVQGSDQDTSPIVWSDLEGTASTSAGTSDDNKLLIVEVAQPRYRYLRAVVDRTGSGGAVDGIIAMQSGAAAEPVTQDSTVLSCESHLAPAAGTA